MMQWGQNPLPCLQTDRHDQKQYLSASGKKQGSLSTFKGVRGNYVIVVRYIPITSHSFLKIRGRIFLIHQYTKTLEVHEPESCVRDQQIDHCPGVLKFLIVASTSSSACSG